MTKEQFDFLFKKGKEMMDRSKDKIHDWSHVARVLDYALQIKYLLPNQKKEIINDDILKLSCVWHDVSYVYYSAGFIQYFMEAKRSVKIIKKEFALAGVSQEEISLISKIVLWHGFSTFGALNRKNDLYCQILQDADTLDGFNLERIKQADKLIKKSFFWLFVVKILRPLFLNFLIKHKEKILNLPESISIFRQNH